MGIIESAARLPLFPLQTVLVPGGFLPLQIFEPRYLDMVKECVRDESGFGVCLVLENSDLGTASQHARIGTLARIRDWHTMDNGLLGITSQGHERFIIKSTRMRDNGLMIGEVEWLPNPPTIPVPDAYLLLSGFVERFMDKLSINYPGYEESQLDDADWISYRLTELLPLKNLERPLYLNINSIRT